MMALIRAAESQTDKGWLDAGINGIGISPGGERREGYDNEEVREEIFINTIC